MGFNETWEKRILLLLLGHPFTKRKSPFRTKGAVIEQATACVNCGEYSNKENAVNNDNEIYCLDCWEITFGYIDDNWPPSIV